MSALGWVIVGGILAVIVGAIGAVGVGMLAVHRHPDEADPRRNARRYVTTAGALVALAVVGTLAAVVGTLLALGGLLARLLG